MRNILFSSICASFLAITAISTATADEEVTVIGTVKKGGYRTITVSTYETVTV
ncbi:MAG: hypothetical protein JJE15_02940 [Desulfobacteraceae bacterium]|nr:hypothetical protein [Desulfobacteraceae bacterium]